ncbi:hypothetical protein CONPUDRAFT_74253 [Coniophora puteana RWD-64-598 SS2]|uniref:Uncharacterized protein n=1 Tax=Coniophora puteana (strain RWD-64-598) TaxID=741705 RepID=A0A5M3MLA5_CONPW|nr:uncharacterized protein CONPUDRAFT_74253 [Coniophora puteana RWD-64-598 SS2]EIW79948.1 hypothetical protein CONPUDRAFT_74253 [Coniophora puteana RWD-64-598 SS2]
MAELLHDKSNVPISHILITSRPLPQLVAVSQSAHIRVDVSSVSIDGFDATNDIKTYLEHSFNALYLSRRMDLIIRRPWPTEDVLTSLSRRVQGRFIVAATIVRLVALAEHPADCLDLVANLYDGRVNTIDIDLRNIDSLYHYIISQAHDGSDLERRTGAMLLSDIIALARPLSVMDICALFGVNVLRGTEPLLAIICVPEGGPVQIYHTSLRDYLRDESRSQELHVHPSSSHSRLAQSCFRKLRGMLRPRRTDRDLEQHIREETDTGNFRYALTHWSFHLRHSDQSAEIKAFLFDFLSNYGELFVQRSQTMGRSIHAKTSLIEAMFVVEKKWAPFDRQDEVLALLRRLYEGSDWLTNGRRVVEYGRHGQSNRSQRRILWYQQGDLIRRSTSSNTGWTLPPSPEP